MKKLYTLLLLMGGFVFAYAQNDTLLFENFNELWDTDPLDFGEDGVSPLANGNDTIWVSFDADGIADANGRSQKWYSDTSGWFAEDSLQGGVLLSSSWLTGYAPGNRNWLVTPPIQIVDSTAVLSWKSAPYQGPRYMDGYSVYISTASNDMVGTSDFSDLIFQVAQMDAITGAASGSGASVDTADFAFSPGYIHAAAFTDSSYFIPYDSTFTSVLNYGLLEPHSVDLAQYAGQTIYIAFVHDADDDNLMALDDILVTGTMPPPVNTEESKTLEADLEVYPNPADDFITVNYTMEDNVSVNISVLDIQGRVVESINDASNAAGTFNQRVNVSNLAAGNYTVIINAEGKTAVQRFIKK